MSALSPEDMLRYQKQLLLPEISVSGQKRLKDTRLMIVGAGGLGSAALPYLAGAGIGQITIVDDDVIDLSNLHRQTIFRTDQAGQSKAKIAAAYAQNLNPECSVRTIDDRLDGENFYKLCKDHDMLFDGTDNFRSKIILNRASIEMKIPLVSGSVTGLSGQAALFAGYLKDRPCYHCLFDELPMNIGNCNELGVLGPAAGITGLYQAHLALCYLLQIEPIQIGSILSFDFHYLRMQHLTLKKDPNCTCCNGLDHQIEEETTTMDEDIPLLSIEELKQHNHHIVDVREHEELQADPVESHQHTPLGDLHHVIHDLPKDRKIAFVCAGNVRSRIAAEMLYDLGYQDVVVLDKFSL